MTTTTESLGTFTLSEANLTTAERQWKFADLTPDEIRCLWVLQSYLGEMNRRFYHLSYHPAPKRLTPGLSRAAFVVPFRNEDLASYDMGGLAALTAAFFVARVRVSFGTEHAVWHGPPDDPYLQWDVDSVYLRRDSERCVEIPVLLLHARMPEGDRIFERHPGPDYLRDTIARLEEQVQG